MNTLNSVVVALLNKILSEEVYRDINNSVLPMDILLEKDFQ